MRNDYLFKNKCYEWKNSKKVFIFSYCANKCCNSNVVTSSEGEISSNFSKARCQWNCPSLPMTHSPKKEAAPAAGSREAPVRSCTSHGCFHADNVETLASDSSGILAACLMFSDYIEMFLKVSM